MTVAGNPAVNRYLAGEAAALGLAAVDAALNVSASWPQILSVVVAVLALLVRRRWPVAVFLLTLPALAVVGSVIATLVALYAVAVRNSDRWLLAGCGVLGALGYLFPGPDLNIVTSDTVLAVIYAAMTAAAPIFLGQFVRAHRDIVQAREHERLLDAQAVLAKERNQLAREMHDVVSHQVSLIAVQAGALQVSAREPATRNVAENIRQLSVDTLDELRHMVNLLRASGTAGGELSPQPTLSDLEHLVHGSGIPARMVGSAPSELDALAQRTIYRTVQEALTNVRKHAPGSVATVEFSRDDNDLTVTVSNTPPRLPTLTLPSARHGLVGLEERAALLGGTMTAAPTGDGGFALRLRLPMVDLPSGRRESGAT
ncbi:sensor histidine kinase [Kutzneria sp. CA-103260]|uniref:sensor histidine kinase n=1 Tax=Kutzneria sp. CA-103260 TaxID=2802641 RepID=UPI001BA4FFD3|nr:histidine kinase [Kutzneria sp. CA-103260]QUQ65705.1 two-component sensor histidine kinase [Kutzneria sp. CA-103260]